MKLMILLTTLGLATIVLQNQEQPSADMNGPLQTEHRRLHHGDDNEGNRSTVDTETMKEQAEIEREEASPERSQQTNTTRPYGRNNMPQHRRQSGNNQTQSSTTDRQNDAEQPRRRRRRSNRPD